MLRSALLLLLLAAPVAAQDYVMPRIPTEEEKTDALRRAYAPVPRTIVTVPVKPTPAAGPAGPAEQPDLNMDDLRKFARRANHKIDICARHGMRKVTTNHGKSWRCK